MNIMALIELLDEELSSATGVFLTGKRLVDVEKCLAMISDLRINLPDEIKDAERIVAEKNEILNSAENEAQHIIAEAERRFEQMLEEHNVTRTAYERAQSMLSAAREESRQIIIGATGYAEEILDTVERNARATIAEASKNRAELNELIKRNGTV